MDRANYCRSSRGAYDDRPQSIGFGATISAPHMHAHALSILEPCIRRPNSRVLDVGSGSGIFAAAALELILLQQEQGEGSGGGSGDIREGDCAAAADASTGGLVVGIEHIRELVEWSTENVKKDGKADHLDSRRLLLLEGDGYQGYAPEAPYDVIHVGAAPETGEHV